MASGRMLKLSSDDWQTMLSLVAESGRYSVMRSRTIEERIGKQFDTLELMMKVGTECILAAIDDVRIARSSS